jgi:peptidoglycan/LPS O-acetylase OafA/YrhL
MDHPATSPPTPSGAASIDPHVGSRVVAREGRIEWIDELRGIAALSVALVHSMSVLWLGIRGLRHAHGANRILDVAMAVISVPAHYGYAGVMLFFLLSGFVIHLPYAGGRRPFVFGPYFIRRFLRIYPPYLVALLISLAVAVALPSAYAFQFHLANMDATHIAKAFFFLQNYPHDGGPKMQLAGNQPAANLALWSLPVEMELYFAYPLLLLGLRRLGMTRLTIAVIAVSVLATFIDVMVAAPNGKSPNLANFQPTFLHYWAIWAAGAWLAERVRTNSLPAWHRTYAIALIVVAMLSLIARPLLHLPYEVEDAFWGAVFFLVLLWLGGSAPKKIPALRPLASVGLISYSLYLIHIPTFLVIAAIWGTTHQTLSSNFSVCLLAVAAAVPVAALMYVTIERPSIEIARRLSDRRV